MLGVGEAIQPDEPSFQSLVPKQIVFATIIFVAVAALGNETSKHTNPVCSPLLFLLITQRSKNSLEGKEEVQSSFHQ